MSDDAGPPTHAKPATMVLRSPHVPVTTQRLYDFLWDVKNHLILHPLLVDIETLQEPVRVEGTDGWMTATYRFTDQLVYLGFYKKKISFPGQMWYKPGHNVIYWRATVSGVVLEHEQIIMSAEEAGEGEGATGSYMEQRSWLSAPWVVRAYVRSSARQAHIKMLTRLSQHFAQELSAAPSGAI